MPDAVNPLADSSVREMRAALSDARAAGAPLTPTGVPGMAFVARSEHVREALRATDLSCRSNFLMAEGDGDPTPLLIIQSDPPRHTALRNLLRPAFQRAAMTDAAPWITEIVDDLLDALPDGGPADLMGELAEPLTSAVIARLIGVPGADADRLAQLSGRIAAMVPANIFVTDEWAELEGYFQARAEERRAMAQQPDDVLTRLVTATMDGMPMSAKEVAFHAWQLFVAGVESTAYTIGWTVHHLLADRDRWEALRADRSLLPLAREEGLRHCTAIRWVMRTATEDGNLGGAEIPAGQRVLIGLESANLDETEFGPDAAEFNLRRESARRHVAFGHGIHLCLGAELSRIEITTTLDRLLDRMPHLRLADPEAQHELRSPIFRGMARVDVLW